MRLDGEEAAPPARPDGGGSGETAAVASGGGVILIVEDNQVNLMILRAMLRKRGYEPMVATDGAQGVEMSERHRPRLVLMDLQMPRLDGLGAAAEIARRLGDAPPAMVAVTANASDEVLAACRAAGFADVLTKPIVFDELIATVERHLAAG